MPWRARDPWLSPGNALFDRARDERSRGIEPIGGSRAHIVDRATAPPGDAASTSSPMPGLQDAPTQPRSSSGRRCATAEQDPTANAPARPRLRRRPR